MTSIEDVRCNGCGERPEPQRVRFWTRRQRAKAPPVDEHLLCYCCGGNRTAGVCKDSIPCPVARLDYNAVREGLLLAARHAEPATSERLRGLLLPEGRDVC